MNESQQQFDRLIHAEMLAHPALFTHPCPVTVALIADDHAVNILNEILKHPNLGKILVVQNSSSKEPNACEDARVQFSPGDPGLKCLEVNSYDIIIADSHVKSLAPNDYQQLFGALTSAGILVRDCDSHYQSHALKTTYENMLQLGFADLQVMHFNQADIASGAALLAFKSRTMRRVREKDIYNKRFQTQYYNLEMHKASFALPEFIRTELDEITA